MDIILNQKWVDDINKDPSTENVRKNDDGSLYIPISITQTMLDNIFLGHWSFEMVRETYGRKWARGVGRMTVIHPHTDREIVRSGDAGILMTGNIRLDSPRLEAMVLLSCARKFGRVLGRDLNRTRDDAPLPVIKVEHTPPPSEEESRLIQLIEQCDTVEKLQTFLLLAKTKKVMPAYNKKLNDLFK